MKKLNESLLFLLIAVLTACSQSKLAAAPEPADTLMPRMLRGLGQEGSVVVITKRYNEELLYKLLFDDIKALLSTQDSDENHSKEIKKGWSLYLKKENDANCRYYKGAIVDGVQGDFIVHYSFIILNYQPDPNKLYSLYTVVPGAIACFDEKYKTTATEYIIKYGKDDCRNLSLSKSSYLFSASISNLKSCKAD